MRPGLVTAGVALAACGALIAVAVSGPLPPINLPQEQVAALSGIDVRIRKEQIEDAFGPGPVTDLIAVARDADQDPGVRLRAYRAIGLYQTVQARTALRFDLDHMLAEPATGTDLLYLRAAIEALGQQQEPLDVDELAPFLNFEASRDIRAATADALRVLGSTDAIAYLQDRYEAENRLEFPSEQVRLAITRALRDLGQPQ